MYDQVLITDKIQEALRLMWHKCDFFDSTPLFSAEQSGVRRPEPSKPELVAMLLAAEYMNAECELFRRLSHGWNFLGNAVTTHNVISHKGDRERFRLKDNRQI